MQLLFQDEVQIKELVSYLSDRPIHKRIVLKTSEPESCLQMFFKYFQLIEAGGGLVWNDDGHLLMILRNGKWDLPKGKLEDGEAIEEAAMREVEEECGIGGLSIQSPAFHSYHIYWMGRKPILKKTHWYEMKTSDKRPPTPQTEEGITSVVWANRSQVEANCQNTFANIRNLLKMRIRG